MRGSSLRISSGSRAQNGDAQPGDCAWSRVWIPYNGTGQADSPDWERQTHQNTTQKTPLSRSPCLCQPPARAGEDEAKHKPSRVCCATESSLPRSSHALPLLSWEIILLLSVGSFPSAYKYLQAMAVETYPHLTPPPTAHLSSANQKSYLLDLPLKPSSLYNSSKLGYHIMFIVLPMLNHPHVVDALFNTLFNSVCKYLIEGFCICVPEGNWGIVFFCCFYLYPATVSGQ